jgi:predicted AlkP superfamily pyrophosphatase or phosphodiesterase
MINRMRKTFCIIFIGLIINSFLFGQDTTQQVIAGRKNNPDQFKKPYVILISADGFRADFAEIHQASFLQSMAKKGVKADYMTPSFPTLTFPNHYSIITGLYPSHHGLVDNTFYDKQRGEFYGMSNKKKVADGSWYGGTPLWVLAEQQKMLSASFYWVASEANIQNTYPTYFYAYNEQISIASRIQSVKNWLSLPIEKRPHFITFYFPQVDHDAHEYGPNDINVTHAVKFVDSSIQALQAALEPLGLPINYVFVSDHGMTKVDNIDTKGLPEAIDTSAFVIPAGEALLHLYAKDRSQIEPTYLKLKKDTSLTVYHLDETPDYWHYKAKDDKFNRLGDLILVTHLPKIFNLSKRKSSLGKHGFDNHLIDMRASFIAWGPAFKKGYQMQGFENVNIYPLIAHILGLNYDEMSIDGKLDVLKSSLVK